jgi:hypothetical protein
LAFCFRSFIVAAFVGVGLPHYLPVADILLDLMLLPTFIVVVVVIDVAVIIGTAAGIWIAATSWVPRITIIRGVIVVVITVYAAIPTITIRIDGFASAAAATASVVANLVNHGVITGGRSLWGVPLPLAAVNRHNGIILCSSLRVATDTSFAIV